MSKKAPHDLARMVGASKIEQAMSKPEQITTLDASGFIFCLAKAPAGHEMSLEGIERHSSRVGKVVYYRMHGARWPYVLVYLTSEGLVTDQDVMSR